MIWFEREAVKEVVSANNSAKEELALRLRALGEQNTRAVAESVIPRDDRYGLITMVSVDKKTSISLSGRFIEIRCADLPIPDAWASIGSLAQVIMGTSYPLNCGITIEFYGVTRALVGGEDPEKILMERLLKGYPRNELDGIIDSRVSGASTRLFFDADNAAYSLDIGPDLCGKRSLFVRLRSRRSVRCSFELLKSAWQSDAERWGKTAARIVGLSLRGEE
jgi:hypothetical protein